MTSIDSSGAADPDAASNGSRAASADVRPAAGTATAPADAKPTRENPFTLPRYLRYGAVLLLSVSLVLFTQQLKLWFTPTSTPLTTTTLTGLGTLWLFSLVGIVIGDLMTLSRIPVLRTFPVLGWVSLVSLFSCLAWDGFVHAIAAVDFLSLTTPVLAFAGISVADRLVDLSRTSWKVAITAIFVFIGTYTGSALLAQFGLFVSGS